MSDITVKNPIMRIGRNELIEFIRRIWEDQKMSSIYGNFTPNGDSLIIEEGQHGEFTGISIELKPKD